jgi:DNA-binding MarR family transcriptional regulator
MATGEQPQPLDGAERDFWLAFVRVLLAVPRVLDADLRADQDLSLTEYATLMHLSEVPERRLRMSELAGRLALSMSAMTRIVARLSADGLLCRERAGDDARGMYAVLSDAGFARLVAAYPDHLASVRRHVIGHLGELDLPAVTRALNAFVDGASGESLPSSVECPDEVACLADPQPRAVS